MAHTATFAHKGRGTMILQTSNTPLWLTQPPLRQCPHLEVKKAKGKEISVKGVPANNHSPIVYLKVRNAEGKNINKRGISK